MATQYPELFLALIAEFSRDEVKTRPQGGRQLSYITARTAMNRLDNVLGPENWWDEYFPMENSVLCKLSIRLPDGSILTKSDAGGYAGMTDQGDDDKSGFSDAFKRAAVKFGVGRYLYHDGVPKFKTPASAPAPAAKPAPNGKPAPKPPGKAPVNFKAWVTTTCEEINQKWVDDLTKRYGGRLASAPGEVINEYQLANHLLKWGKAQSLVSEASSTCEGAWGLDQAVFAAEALDYCRKEWAKARAKVKPHREPGDDDMSEDEHAVLDAMAKEGKA